MKRCSLCGQHKPTDDFWKNAATPDGRHWWCKPCARVKYNAYRASIDPRRVKTYHLKSRYGITLEDRDALFVKQKGLCAICETRMQRVIIDHDHATGECRGLLCHRCNVQLGTIEALIKRNHLDASLTYLSAIDARSSHHAPPLSNDMEAAA